MTPFGRDVVLRYGVPGEPGREHTALAVSFRVEMTDTATPNTATIVAHNLAADSVALLQRPDVVVELLAGYGGAPRLIFRGEPVPDGVEERQDGTDRVLELQLQDGGRAWRLARVSVSMATGTTLGQVFDAVAEAVGLPLGTLDIDRTIDIGPTVLAGPARDVLDALAEASNARWSIQDGVLHVIARSGQTSDRAVVFSSSAGNLIGSPARKDGGVEVKALIDPSMRPGRPFRVESRFVNGDFVAREVDFVGGLRDNDFYVVVRGRPRRS